MSTDWTSLPDLVWYSICDYLPNFPDLIHLSSTNQNLYNLMDQQSFWRHLIRLRYGSTLLQRYCDQLFVNKNHLSLLCSSDEHFVEFERQYSQLPAAILHNGWNLIVTGAQNGNMKGFAAAKRAKFHLPKISSQLKMSMDEKQFRELITHENNPMSLLKLIYYFLSKRILLSFAFQTCICFDPTRISNFQRPDSLPDASSQFGSIAILDSKWLAATRGEFQSIIPGRYAIRCRMKLNLLRCQQPSVEDQFTGELTCIPEFGLMSSFEWDQEWFDLHYVIHSSTTDVNRDVNSSSASQWFEEQMGTITVYELSTVYFGLRVWQMPYRKYTVMCDYIELKIIE